MDTSMPRARSNAKEKAKQINGADQTWQQTKSQNTRNAILDATLESFFEVGYGRTTTERVAQNAGVSRGAMLHHFPSRAGLIHAAIEHLNTKRLALFERSESRIQANASHTHIAEGIDSYWKQLNSKWFVIFHELQVAARTDPDLHAILLPAIRAFDERWLALSERVFPDLSHSHNFMLGNFLTMFLLEGMAMNRFTRRTGKWNDVLLTDLKRRLIDELFVDVTNIDRTTTPRVRSKRRKRSDAPSTPT